MASGNDSLEPVRSGGYGTTAFNVTESLHLLSASLQTACLLVLTIRMNDWHGPAPSDLSRLTMIKKFFRSIARKPNRQTTRMPLQMEALEHRRVLAAGTAVVQNGVLTICGDDAANTIVVAEISGGYFVAADFLASNRTFSSGQVNSIRVEGGGGNDTIVATSISRFITLEGGDGNDRIFGGRGQDLIRGGAGDDLIYGNGGNDTLLGGDGNDIHFGGEGNDAINGNAGADIVHGNGGSDNLRGEAGVDNLFGGAGIDTLYGGDDDDLLIGGAGADTINGNDGNDTLIGAAGPDTLNGDNGDDLVVGGENDDNLSGGNGEDRLFGDNGSDEINGGADGDLIFGGTGPDMIFGSFGADSIFGGVGNDVVSGGHGVDRIFGGSDMDILIGGADADEIYGDGGQDYIIGGESAGDDDAATLDAARTVWTAVGNYNERIDRTEGILTAIADIGNNRILGNQGLDAFVSNDASEIIDAQAGEESSGIEFVANADFYNAAIGETIEISAADGVLANDSALGTGSVTVVSQPISGSVTLNSDGSFSFTQSTRGSDFFIYELTNELGDVDVARVNIEVGGEFPPLDDSATLTALASGVEIFDFEVGNGASPVATDTVNVTYVGYLPNGEIFDQNDGIDFALSGLIDGFAEGVQGMNIGGRRRIVIPPDQGYGPDGNPGAGIGGEDVIVFDVTLNSIADLDNNEFIISESAANGTTVGTATTTNSSLGSQLVYEIVDPDAASELALNADDHFSGSTSAQLVLIDYQSFQCSICAVFHDQLQLVEEEFPDELLVVSRHLTLSPRPFPLARLAAQNAEAAAQQGMFNEMADLIYGNRESWVDSADPQIAQAVFDGFARTLGLDLDQFAVDRVDAAADESINQDEADAAALGLTGTPSLFLNGQQLSPNAALSNLSLIIEAELENFDAPFVIDRLSGEITVATTDSLAAASVETLDVRITDVDGNSVIETITINVTA